MKNNDRPAPIRPFLTDHDLERLTGQRVQTWRFRRMRGDGPAYIKHLRRGNEKGYEVNAPEKGGDAVACVIGAEREPVIAPCTAGYGRPGNKGNTKSTPAGGQACAPDQGNRRNTDQRSERLNGRDTSRKTI